MTMTAPNPCCDHLARFIAQCTERKPDCYVRVEDMDRAYVTWCAKQGIVHRMHAPFVLPLALRDMGVVLRVRTIASVSKLGNRSRRNWMVYETYRLTRGARYMARSTPARVSCWDFANPQTSRAVRAWS